jgi:hypothetical protein
MTDRKTSSARLIVWIVAGVIIAGLIWFLWAYGQIAQPA